MEGSAFHPLEVPQIIEDLFDQLLATASAIAERELLSLHHGDFARYRIRPSQFAAWQEAWSR